VSQRPERLFLQCAPGLEAALEAELGALGVAGPFQRLAGGVEVDTAPGAYQALNLWSRVAERILVRAPGKPRGGVDTTGELLHFRGYRQEVGRAPLRETLAAGVLWLGGFQPGAPLWDVMCGSGTLCIEAAEWSLGLAPGRNRTFAFQGQVGHDARAFAALPRSQAGLESLIVGSDLNAGALGTARRNARRAGVLERLTLERLDATRLAPRPGVAPGLVVANLPYGRRVGARGELERLFRALGASLRVACPGWRFAFLLEAGAEALGLELARRQPVLNGGLHCEVVTGVIPGT
jgi:putative N6-adenine-specific DNA methylase